MARVGMAAVPVSYTHLIVGLGARDIMGYCLIMLLYSGVVICGAFYLLG